MSLRVRPITEKLRGHYWRDLYIYIYLNLNFLAIQHYANHESESENLIIFIPLNNLQNNNSEIQYNVIQDTLCENTFQFIFIVKSKEFVNLKKKWFSTYWIK